MENATNILVAIDLGESSKEALVKARQLWDRSGAKLYVLCVVQDPFLLPWAPAADAGVMTTLSAQMQHDAQAYLRSLLPPHECERYHAELAVCTGARPSDTILAYAAANRIDLIVMGKGNRQSPEAAAEVGSVTEAVVRRATCSVLVVPPQHPQSDQGARHDAAALCEVLR